MLKRLFGGTKSYQVTVEPFGTTLTVGPKETLLKAALAAGLAYPFECQTGACATCKTQLLEGDIKALTDFAYVLDLEEMQNGTILACQSLARSDLRIKVTTLDDGLAVIAPRTIGGTISALTPLTRDIVEVRMSLDAPLAYYAGQYANVRVPEIDSVRAYSFAAAPGTDGSADLTFHIRVLPDGEFSGWLASGDRVGAAVEVDGPYGVFRLREADGPIVCIAGGSGMAPIKAMLEHAAASGTDRPVVYLYGARTADDLYPDDTIAALESAWPGAFRFVPVLSEEPADSAWTGARGLVTEFIGAIDDFELAGAQAYLCGPPAMIDAAVPVLNNAGVRGRDIFFDKFTDRSHGATPS